MYSSLPGEGTEEALDGHCKLAKVSFELKSFQSLFIF
jgi:hypothetical protein